MKRNVLFFLAVIMVIGLLGCQNTQSDPCDLPSGVYYLGNYVEYQTPYLKLNFEDHTFSMGGAEVMSYAERGSFVVKGNKITATSQNTVFIFEIKDQNTLILVDNGDNEYSVMPENTEWVFHHN